MQHQLRKMSTVTLVGVLAVALAVGCATTGRKRTGKTESVVSNLETRMELAINQIDAAVISLTSLQGLRGDFLTKQYAVFKKEVAAIEKMEAGVRSRADAMKKQGEAYFAAWEEGLESIDDAEIRQMSETRKAELRQKYGDVSVQMQAAREAYNAFIGDLRNVQKSLDLDLSPTAVEMLGGKITQAEKDAETLKQELTDVTMALQQLSKKMSTGA